MWLTIEDAIEIYARFCLSRFGEDAIEKVAARARHLERNGDIEGGRVWDEVAREIGRHYAAGEPD